MYQQTERLNDAEQAMLALVGSGRTYSDIASATGLADREVGLVVRLIFDKIAVLDAEPTGVDPYRELGCLSYRQQQVLILLAADKTNQGIATALALSAGRAKDIVSEVLRRLNVPSRTGAAIIFTRALGRATA